MDKLTKRPPTLFCMGADCYFQDEADLMFDSQDARIAELERDLDLEHSRLESIRATNLWMEKELRVMREAAREAYSAMAGNNNPFDVEVWTKAVDRLSAVLGIEAARKELEPC